ncbi:helix-turn-helix domain-containing protein [Sphingomonas montanisoli]|uniref:Helix-turn-helix domain-containing protein n=1 Tax=Sphingomonas montanisoli TaxID=2606412 RepID=A0A5D9C4T2_9SPHN|nr:helix-turn-helix domain-containing protein [Sphingomonas montanisoli]TZG24985.1 helix-turn-helix domain-containing protein [Sphingomonas montanisoli]
MIAAPSLPANVGNGFTFSSEGRDPDLAFDEYRQLYANGSDVERAEGPFHAHVTAWRLGNMLLFDRRLDGLIHSRTERVASDGFDHFVLYAMIDGEIIGSPESRFDRAGAGNVVLLDTSMATRTQAVGAHYLTVSIARHLVEAIVDDPASLHGMVLRPPSTLILIDFLASLAHRAPGIATAAMPNLSRVLVDLLAIALAGYSRPGSETRQQNLLRRQSVESYIARHLADRRLSAATISDATGISRSSLYRLYDRQGGIARLVQMRRLEAIRAAIEDGSTAGLGELAQQFGFASEAHMSRVFSEVNGRAPGAYRREVQANPDEGVLTARRRWVGWMSELS